MCRAHEVRTQGTCSGPLFRPMVNLGEHKAGAARSSPPTYRLRANGGEQIIGRRMTDATKQLGLRDYDHVERAELGEWVQVDARPSLDPALPRACRWSGTSSSSGQ